MESSALDRNQASELLGTVESLLKDNNFKVMCLGGLHPPKPLLLQAVLSSCAVPKISNLHASGGARSPASPEHSSDSEHRCVYSARQLLLDTCGAGP